MDDYFYPYPTPGVDFPDDLAFAAYGRGFADKGDWRRDNGLKNLKANCFGLQNKS